ncbi:secreted RxLR effector protein 161-like [Pistacia vera]|uniref:secreted RxLR effector protein 161-like n=1 Tax=Pistacia vera TaxID=55513 RepID=UPI0012633088|nr:secreted RxLR effector protein 161-like [Pistacia vera]
MLDCKPVDSPMDPNVKLVPGQGKPLKDLGRYRKWVDSDSQHGIGAIDCIAVRFLTAVSMVSQFLQAPCSGHWDAAICILKYIKEALEQGLLYENRGHSQIVGYSDADWAGSASDRQSISGYCIMIGGNLISWKCKKQDVVARSSVAAEYWAMALATCELIWLKQLLQELGVVK